MTYLYEGPGPRPSFWRLWWRNIRQDALPLMMFPLGMGVCVLGILTKNERVAGAGTFAMAMGILVFLWSVPRRR